MHDGRLCPCDVNRIDGLQRVVNDDLAAPVTNVGMGDVIQKDALSLIIEPVLCSIGIVAKNQPAPVTDIR